MTIEVQQRETVNLPVWFMVVEPLLNYLRSSVRVEACAEVEASRAEVTEVILKQWRALGNEAIANESVVAIPLTLQHWNTLVEVCSEAATPVEDDVLTHNNAWAFEETLMNLREIELSVRVLGAVTNESEG